MSGGFIVGDAAEAADDGEALFDLDIPDEPAAAPIEALSSSQERRLTIWLDERFLQLSRGISKRHQPGSDLNTLKALISATRQLLHVILSIPPQKSGNILRAEFLLRLTGEITVAMVDYSELSTREGRKQLFDAIEELDKGWEIVLRALSWPQSSNSRNLAICTDVTGTQKARLLSLIQQFKQDLGESVNQQNSAQNDEDSDDSEMEMEEIEVDGSIAGRESVLHVELDVRKTFSRTLKIIAL